MSAMSSDGPLLAAQRLEREYQSTYYKIAQRRGDKVPAEPAQLEVPEGEKPPMLEGIYRTRLKQQPPAEWKDLGSDERTAKMREAVIGSWAQSELLLRQLAQARAATIRTTWWTVAACRTSACTCSTSASARRTRTARSTPLQLGSE